MLTQRNAPLGIKLPRGADMAPLITTKKDDDDGDKTKQVVQSDVINDTGGTKYDNSSDIITDLSSEELESLEEEIFLEHLDIHPLDIHPTSNSQKYPLSPDSGILDISDVFFQDCAVGDVTNSDYSPTVPTVAIETEQQHHPIIPIPRSMPFAALTMNLSFAGCGFLGIYHLGVVHVLAHHGSKLLLNVQKFGGASAGALIASALAIRGPDKQVIQECTDFCYKLAETVQQKKMGVLTPRLSLLEPLQNFLEEMLPEDAHIIASNRLFISVTDARRRKNYIKSEFESKAQLIQYLLGSSYVPFVTGSKAVRVEGKKYLDGGMTNNLPEIPHGRTIYVTPFSGNQHICPSDKQGKGWYINLQGEDFQVNRCNLKRGLHAFFPPKRKHLEKYFERGKSDAIRFLKRENFYSASES